MYAAWAKYEKCPNCNVAFVKGTGHVCADNNKLEKKVNQEMKGFDKELEKYLDSKEAKFFEHLSERGKL